MGKPGMELPDICHVVNDPQRNIRYEVFAYRELSREEVVVAVRNCLLLSKRKPKKNTCLKVFTLVGLRD